MSLRKYIDIVNNANAKSNNINEWNPFKKKATAAMPSAPQSAAAEVTGKEWNKIKALEYFIYQHIKGGVPDEHGDVPFHIQTLKKMAQQHAGNEAAAQIEAFLKELNIA